MTSPSSSVRQLRHCFPTSALLADHVWLVLIGAYNPMASPIIFTFFFSTSGLANTLGLSPGVRQLRRFFDVFFGPCLAVLLVACPPQQCRVLYFTERPCSLDADRSLRSDVTTDSYLGRRRGGRSLRKRPLHHRCRGRAHRVGVFSHVAFSTAPPPARCVVWGREGLRGVARETPPKTKNKTRGKVLPVVNSTPNTYHPTSSDLNIGAGRAALG